MILDDNPSLFDDICTVTVTDNDLYAYRKK